MEFETNIVSKYSPDVNSYNKTVIDYFGGQYGIYWPSKSHIDFHFASVYIDFFRSINIHINLQKSQ